MKNLFRAIALEVLYQRSLAKQRAHEKNHHLFAHPYGRAHWLQYTSIGFRAHSAPNFKLAKLRA